MEQTRPKPTPARSDVGHHVPLQVLFHGRWCFAVLRELVSGPARLSQLRRNIPDCSKKMLIDTLHGLEQIGWIQRQEYATRVKRVEYALKEEWAKRILESIAIVEENESEELIS